jgi:hypothetical protein
MRYVVGTGSDVGCHSATHTYWDKTNLITISATGTSPTLSIAGTRTGDSSTWTGTMTVTINGTSLVLDLGTAYPTLASVITALNGTHVGDGIVSASVAEANIYTIGPSLYLGDVTGQSIAVAQNIIRNEAAFFRVEVTESLMDLRSFIRTGKDRNGLHDTGLGDATGTVAYYEVPFFGTPGSVGHESGYVAATNLGIRISGSLRTSTGYSISRCNRGVAFELADLASNDGDTDERTKALALCALGNEWATVLYHTAPTYNGTLQGFIDMLDSYGLVSVSYSDVMHSVTNGGLWSLSGTSCTYTAAPSAGIIAADYRIPTTGGLRSTGIPDGSQFDILGIPSPLGTKDIGPYEIP